MIIDYHEHKKLKSAIFEALVDTSKTAWFKKTLVAGVKIEPAIIHSFCTKLNISVRALKRSPESTFSEFLVCPDSDSVVFKSLVDLQTAIERGETTADRAVSEMEELTRLLTATSPKGSVSIPGGGNNSADDQKVVGHSFSDPPL
ncbi:hypothetical protein [Aestuariispira insulae]|uniref:Uncharacterized protein n=1 Tax=Aestuariispira insulae TaxID=1461337 RepID=A0A3D9H5B1_9PROT|nr:hypothetical protein [Aestuariispira insulae]RED44136.1 hypothetical protein DFP90_11740 [Aestuariispira insulae]